MNYTNIQMSNKKPTSKSVKLPLLLIKQTYINWRNDRTLRLGAGLAYYGVFTIVPILTLMIAIATYFFSIQDINLFAQEAFTRIFSSELSGFMTSIVDSVTAESVESRITTSSIISLVVLVIASSAVFIAFQDALDTIWQKPIRLGWKKWLKKHVWAYIVVMIVGLILLGVLIINSLGSIAVSLLPGQFIVLENLTNALVSIGTWTLGILVLTIIYRMLINHKISWAILIIGSTITAVLIVFGTWLLGVYISNYASGSFSGAVGAILLLLVWVYYEAQIILVGAQVIKTLDQNKEKLPHKIVG
jgi:membrane protein